MLQSQESPRSAGDDPPGEPIVEPTVESIVEVARRSTGVTSDAVDSVLSRYFRNETTLEAAQIALFQEWQEMASPGAHGPAMLALTKWTIRSAAQSAGRDLDDDTLYLLLEPISSLFKRG